VAYIPTIQGTIRAAATGADLLPRPSSPTPLHQGHRTASTTNRRLNSRRTLSPTRVRRRPNRDQLPPTPRRKTGLILATLHPFLMDPPLYTKRERPSRNAPSTEGRRNRSARARCTTLSRRQARRPRGRGGGTTRLSGSTLAITPGVRRRTGPSTTSTRTRRCRNTARRALQPVHRLSLSQLGRGIAR
jgi:hypothetical protein